MTKIRSSSSSHVRDVRGGGGGGGLGGMLGGGGGFPIPMRAGGGLLGLLVVAAAILLPRLLGGADTNTAADTGSGGGAAQCRTDLEQTLCGAVDSVNAYWDTEYAAAFGGQYRAADTVFFSQAVGTGCGQASAQTGPFYCPADNQAYFDLEFLTQLQDQFGAQGDLAAQYIVAHEYGHHIQNLMGTSDRVRQAEQSSPDLANQYSVALELQADCYAGAWANSVKGDFDSPTEVQEAINAAGAVGDDRIQQTTQGRVDPETFTHGTSQQRMDWFNRGFTTGDPTRCTTFAELGLS